MSTKTAKIRLATYKQDSHGEYAQIDDGAYDIYMRLSDLDLAEGALVGEDGVEHKASIIDAKSNVKADPFEALVHLANDDISTNPAFAPDKIVRFNDSPMMVVSHEANGMVLRFAVRRIQAGVRVNVDGGTEKLGLYIRDWHLEYNADKCWLVLYTTVHPFSLLFLGLKAKIKAWSEKRRAAKANKAGGPPPLPQPGDPNRKSVWPRRVFLVLLVWAWLMALWFAGPEAYRFTTSKIGGLFAPSPSASEQPAAPKAVDPLCIPASDYNVLRFFLQSDPKRLVGKVSTYQYGRLGFYCGENVQPPYDAAKKTTDVSACSICIPGEYSKPGKYAMAPDILEKLFFQKDPACFVEPTLPFKPSLQTMRRGLRIDMNCKDYEYIADRGCYDYSKCAIIVP